MCALHCAQEEREWEDEAEAARRAAAESAEAKRVDKVEVDVSAEVAAAIEDEEMGLGGPRCLLQLLWMP